MREPAVIALALVACGPGSAILGPPRPEPPLGLDTGLPRAAPARVRVEVGAPFACGDLGRDARFYDEIELGPMPVRHETGWAGGGLGVEDFDGDGRLEVFVAGMRRSQLFAPSEEGWVDRAATALAGVDLELAVAVSAPDWDGDGDPDLFVTRYGLPHVLLRNDGGRFVDVTAASGLGEHGRYAAAAAWGDLDGDGWLDLVVANYGPPPPDAWDPQMPPGEPSELWRNRGDGTFEDHSHRLPPEVHDAYGFMVALYDLNGDARPEILHVADFGWARPSVLLWNEGGMSFALDDGTAGFHPNFAGMGLAVGDLDGDGLPELAQSSFDTLSLLAPQPSALATRGLLFVERAETLGLAVDPAADQFFGWGTEFGDLENDGDLDLVMGFGHWAEYGGPSAQQDAAWVLTSQGTYAAVQTNPLWQLDDLGVTRGVLLVDLDRDGWLDVVKRPLNRPARVHVTRCAPTASSVAIALRDEASPNRRAAGARVRVTAGGRVHTRWQGGASSMFSAGPAEVHVGLGDATRVDHLEITWPDGERTELADLPVGRPLTLTRTAG